MLHRLLISAAALAFARGAAGQGSPSPRPDAGSCDSIVRAARVDSVAGAMYIGVKRSDGGELAPAQLFDLAMAIGGRFAPPRPFQMAAFSGPPRSHFLRAVGDTAPSLRPPTFTGIYRVTTDGDGNIVRLGVARTSLVGGLDSVMLAAIRDASSLKEMFTPPFDDDSMSVDVRISSDSTAGARRMLGVTLPRMPVRDAAPLASNPQAEFPREVLKAGFTAGEVVLRFVVGPDGLPMDDTIELVRGTSLEFVRAAMVALPRQRFRAARVRGCAVPQVIDYSFAFVAPEMPSRAP